MPLFYKRQLTQLQLKDVTTNANQLTKAELVRLAMENEKRVGWFPSTELFVRLCSPFLGVNSGG